MEVRPSQEADIPRILEIYGLARQFQRQVLNLVQWEDGYPSEDRLRQDMALAGSRVLVKDGQVIGTFFIQEGPDQVYLPLKEAWPDKDEIVTIHRIAADSSVPGTGNFIYQWLQDHYDNIMIDTHDRNLVMKHLLAKYGYSYLGEVTIANGTLRNTYQYIKSEGNPC